MWPPSGSIHQYPPSVLFLLLAYSSFCFFSSQHLISFFCHPRVLIGCHKKDSHLQKAVKKGDHHADISPPICGIGFGLFGGT